MKITGRLAILMGAVLLLWAAGIWFQDQETGQEAGERAQEILDEAWGQAQVKLGLTDGMDPSGQAPSLEESVSSASPMPDVAPTATVRPDRVLEKKYAGILEIPSQKLTLCVYDKWSYSNLRNSPCRFSGQSDGTPARLVICGHNYWRHFGKLKRLREGDKVLYMNMYGEVFTYEVTDRSSINPRDFDSLNAGDWDIALVTCTAVGRMRLAIKCVAMAPVG